MHPSRFLWRPEYRIRATREYKHIQRSGKKHRATHLMGIVVQKMDLLALASQSVKK